MTFRAFFGRRPAGPAPAGFRSLALLPLGISAPAFTPGANFTKIVGKQFRLAGAGGLAG